MHYQNDTFLFILQEVSLKYHKSSMKYHKSSIKTALKLHNEAPKEPLSSLQQRTSNLQQRTSSLQQRTSSLHQRQNSLLTIFHDIAQKSPRTLGTQCPQLRATDAQHMVYRCPSRGL